VIILACWNIWEQTNHWIFQHKRPSLRGWKSGFVLDVTMLKHRVKSGWRAPLLTIFHHGLVPLSDSLFLCCKYVVYSLNFAWVIKGCKVFPCSRNDLKKINYKINACILRASHTTGALLEK
jgi:hypothetical protein